MISLLRNVAKLVPLTYTLVHFLSDRLVLIIIFKNNMLDSYDISKNVFGSVEEMSVYKAKRVFPRAKC